MGKQELVEFIAAKAGLTKADATRALDAALEGITTGLKKEGKVALVGFGTFSKKLRPASVTKIMSLLLIMEAIDEASDAATAAAGIQVTRDLTGNYDNLDEGEVLNVKTKKCAYFRPPILNSFIC